MNDLIEQATILMQLEDRDSARFAADILAYPSADHTLPAPTAEDDTPLFI